MYSSEQSYPPELEEDLPSLDSIQQVQELPDGSAVFDIGGEGETPQAPPQDFYSNLAENLSEAERNLLAARLIEEIEEDKASRSEWEKPLEIAMKYLGVNIEDVGTDMRSKAIDSTLKTALIHFYSSARAELFPASGPVKAKINGEPTEQADKQGWRVKTFLNYFLTQFNRDYYPDSETLLIHVGFFGNGFRKVYQDPILNMPTPRFIKPQDLIVNHHTPSLMESSRITHQMQMTRREIVLREQSGYYMPCGLPSVNDEDEGDPSTIDAAISKLEGIKKDSVENKNLFRFYESHTELDAKQIRGLEDIQGDSEEKDLLPRPYIVTICATTKKVVHIKRNWKEGDNTYQKIQGFVHYYYLPSFGLYAWGLAHLMGSNAVTLTDILRVSIDAGMIANIPAWFKSKSVKSEDNNLILTPGKAVEIETGGEPISNCIATIPRPEPSQALIALRQELINQDSTIASTAEAQVAESSTNAPVGTTLALLEVQNRVQSTILRSLHNSLAQELKLLFDLFGECLPDTPYPFSVPGHETSIMRQDFSDAIMVVPVSDPNMITSAHRLLKNEALLKLVQSKPEIHDEREAYRRMYQAMGVEDIEKILPEPQQPQPKSLDAVSENMTMMQGQPVIATSSQDHASHSIVHKKFAMEQQMQNPAAYMAAMSHIKCHDAFEFFGNIMQEVGGAYQAMQSQQLYPQEMQMIQQKLQQFSSELQQILQMPQEQMSQIPAEQLLQIPEVQNMISKKDAEEIQQQEAEQQAMAAQQQQPLDPTIAMLADVEQKREASQLKHEEVKMKTETEAFKAQLKFEGDKAKVEADRDIAEDKNEVTLAVAEMKNTTQG